MTRGKPLPIGLVRAGVVRASSLAPRPPLPPRAVPARPVLRTPRQRAGDAAEDAACAHLVAAGLVLVARNVRFRVGEIDLILEDNLAVVFVEVRMRRGAGFGGAAASVDRFKQNRIVRCAQTWLLQRYGSRWPACRFDVVTVDGSGSLQWLRDAFGAGA
jgi:putative endonuclease